MKNIKIEKARLHNLKNIDVELPKGKFVVATGVSGSGKSSLIFDTVFEEGRKGYLKAIGMVPFIDESEHFESIEGVGPTAAVKQSIIKESNPRSIVGTRTKIYDYMRILYSLEGEMECFFCGNNLGKDMECSSCGNVEERVTAQYFSFNTPNGMCIKCKGRGFVVNTKLDQLIKDTKKSLPEICRDLKITSGNIKSGLKKLAKHFKFDIKTTYEDLPEEVKNIFLYGSRDPKYPEFWGIVNYFRWKASKGRIVYEYMEKKICPSCHGYRIGEEARRVTIKGKHIAELGKMTITKLKEFLEEYLVEKEKHISDYGKNVVKIILKKLSNLIDVGLSHLSLFREMPTLSGGEVQRLFLMSHLDSEIESLIYIFDEPTSGLHEVEKEGLLNRIKGLQELGNSVIIVEHDKNTIEKADHIIDFGPLAGKNGGEVIYEGDYNGLLSCDESITGQYLSGKITMPHKIAHEYIRIEDDTPKFKLKNINTNNLKNIDVEIPIGAMVGICGVSGSGKSSLVFDTLIPMLKSHLSTTMNGSDNSEEKDDLNGEEENTTYNDLYTVGTKNEIEGAEYFKGFLDVMQCPIGRNRRSIPLTYLGVWDKIREIFSNEPKAVESGYNAGDFSFNSSGACSNCKGIGYIETELGELGILRNTCPECSGKRYDGEILQVTYKGKNISDVLNMSVSEGVEFFNEQREIRHMLETLHRIGMGYITLGQPTPTLSGGEAQRIKLGKELGKLNKNKEGKMLYILDEPTTGLSFYDISKLMLILKELVDSGNTVIIVEHDPTVLSFCDWIIELGPEGGNEGGNIIAEGAPMDIKKKSYSKIGRFLEECYGE